MMTSRADAAIPRYCTKDQHRTRFVDCGTNSTFNRIDKMRRVGSVVEATRSQARHDGFEPRSAQLFQHVISLGKEFTQICSGQLSLLPTGWKMSTSFLNPVVHYR